MGEILAKIMAEVLSILSIATKEMQKSRMGKLLPQDRFNCHLTPLVFNRNIFQQASWKDGYRGRPEEDR